MKFEEELPSFKHIKPIILWNSGEYTIEKNISRPDDTAFKVKDIIRLTIDKQRVKEIIKNHIIKSSEELTINAKIIIRVINREMFELLKELNLEDEK